MLRAFAGQISDTGMHARLIVEDGLEEESKRLRSAYALAVVLQGLWLFYSQVTALFLDKRLFGFSVWSRLTRVLSHFT